MKHILILVAMESEQAAVMGSHAWREVPVSQSLSLSAKQVTEHGLTTALMQTGVGQVSAGTALALYADKYPLDAVILLGVGGAIAPQLNPGDAVLATSVVQYDSIFHGDHSKKLMAPGELFLSAPGGVQVDPLMRTDAALSDRLLSLMKASPSTQVHVGQVLSGSAFVGSKQRKQELHGQFPEALLLDMEAAAVAQMARKLRLPFAVLKTVADSANPKTTIAKEYLGWIEQAASKAKGVVNGILSSSGAAATSSGSGVAK